MKKLIPLTVLVLVLASCGGSKSLIPTVQAQAANYTPPIYASTNNVSILHGIYRWHATGVYLLNGKEIPYVEGGVAYFDGLGHVTGDRSTWNLLGQGASGQGHNTGPISTVYDKSIPLCQNLPYGDGTTHRDCTINYTLDENFIGTVFGKVAGDICTLTADSDGSKATCTSVWPNGAWTVFYERASQ